MALILLAVAPAAAGAVTRFVFTNLRDGVGNTEIQVQELRLFGVDGAQLSILSISNPGGSSPGSQGPGNLVDGDIVSKQSKWLDFNMACGAGNCTSTLLVETTAETASYELIKAHDAPKRDPSAWEVYRQGNDGGWALAASEALGDSEMPCRTCWAASYGVFDLSLSRTNASGVSTGTTRLDCRASACSYAPHLCSNPEQGYSRVIRKLIAGARTSVVPRLVRMPGRVKLSFERPSSASPVGVWWPIDHDASIALTNASAFPSWYLPPRESWERSCTGATLHQPVVACFSYFAGNYGHTLHDLLPLVSWLRDFKRDHTLLMPASSTLQATLYYIDQKYTSKQIIFLKEGSAACAASATVVVIPPSGRGNSLLNFAWVRKMAFVTALRSSWLTPVGAVNGFGNGTVILYDRSGWTVKHGRKMTRRHMDSIVMVTKHAMLRFGLSGDLVRYDGKLHASAVPVARQAKLFSNADAVIGPHGAGMANVLWLPTSTSMHLRDCDRPRVLEFVCGERSAVVQNGCPYARSHWVMFATAPWVQWHHQFFTDKSSPSVTWIDLQELRASLKAMWSLQIV
eukprot:Transcript_848.p1 GENE.Transcript_848~~Transcript_848.p1  ORF type:complete len:571 (+),score=5.76 Transcript_848:266-1978(+)